jgi:pilus assembly protein CpaC
VQICVRQTIKPMRRTTFSVILFGLAAAGITAQGTRSIAKASVSSNALASEANAAGLFASEVSSKDAIHLIVGRSMSIETKRRLAKIYVTNPAILYAYTASPNQILVTSKQPGISSVVVWDELGGSQSFLISADIDVSALRGALVSAMPKENISVNGEEGHVLLSGKASSKEAYDVSAKLADLYSKDVTNALVIMPTVVKQVRLKVRIIEVDRSKLNQFGFNFFSAGGNNLAQTTTTQFPSTLSASTTGASASASGGTTSSVGNKTVSITNPLNFLLYSSRFNVGAMLQDMETRQIAQILAEPNITTISGQKANFLAGGEFPFPVVQGGAGGLTSISVEFRPYGVKLEFTPKVNDDGTIELKVAPEVSALDFTNAVQISGYTIPALSTRRAETQVVLKSGQSFAISGLLDRRTTDQYGKTPGIASIPVLGQLFKSKSLNHSTSELIVMVTPEIIDPLSEDIVSDVPKIAVPPLDPKTFDSVLPQIKQP